MNSVLATLSITFKQEVKFNASVTKMPFKVNERKKEVRSQRPEGGDQMIFGSEELSRARHC